MKTFGLGKNKRDVKDTMYVKDTNRHTHTRNTYTHLHTRIHTQKKTNEMKLITDINVPFQIFQSDNT